MSSNVVKVVLWGKTVGYLSWDKSNWRTETSVFASVHSHPGEEYRNRDKAIESMGYGLGGGLAWGDYGNVITDYNDNNRIDRASYVYFPVNHSMYLVSLYNPTYIKRVLSPKGFLIGPLR